MGSAEYKPDRAGFKAMAVSGELRAACLTAAEKGRGIAESMAAEISVTGEYAASFRVRSETVILHTAFGSHPVAAGILENLSPHAAAVEWGNAHDHKPHRILGRTLDGIENG